jgi:hypothetical protein
MPATVRLSSGWVKEHIRAHGSKLFIVERLSVVG